MHGGLLMTVADEIGAWAVIAKTGSFGFTTQFEGRILRGAKIDMPLNAEAWPTKTNPRVMTVEVEIHQADDLVLRARFRFAILDVRAAERLLGSELPEVWRRFARSPKS